MAMDKRQRELIEELSEAAVQRFWVDSFKGMARGSRHLQRVQRIAEYLWQKEGGDEFVVRAGAWIHDVALAHGPDYEPERVAYFTRLFLNEFPLLQTTEIDRLVECAEGHEAGGDFLRLEARLVHDADVLDKSGLLGVVRHIWKMTHLLEKRNLEGIQDLQKLEAHLKARQDRLYTETARRLARYLRSPVELFFQDRKFALKTMAWASRLAGQGIISDKVAEMAASRSDHACMRELKGQLECRYLQDYVLENRMTPGA